MKKNIASNQAGPSSGFCKWLPLLNNFGNKKVLRDNQKVNRIKILKTVAEQEIAMMLKKLVLMA